MTPSALSLLAAVALPLIALAAPAADEVTSLPGWPGPLPSKTFSGFINAGWDVQDGINRTMMMWYMMVQAEVPDPLSAPVLLFSNGGPGASSAFGLFTEFGPLQLSADSMTTNPPTLFRNPYAWTKLANIVILNGPAPVGYSYCTPVGPAGDGTSCGSWNDTRAALFNYNFILGFFDAFPELKPLPFYMAGESYAGVYVGQLTDMILKTSPVPVNLKGIALGDACMGTETLCGPYQRGPWFELLFAAGQGCISLPTFRAIITQCPIEILEQGPISNAPATCQAAVAAAGVECPGQAYFAYNYLDQCPPAVFSGGDGDEPMPSNDVSGYPCGGDQALKAWIELPAVKAALNVAPNAVFESFDNGAGFTYNLTWPSNLPLMRRLQTGADGVRTLIYDGETDPSISSVKAQNWTFSLDFPLKEAWRPWTFPNSSVVAGQVVQFDGDFTFVTIRGSGHMVSPVTTYPAHAAWTLPPNLTPLPRNLNLPEKVPTYRPFSAYLMLQNFLSDAGWPSQPPAQTQKKLYNI